MRRGIDLLLYLMLAAFAVVSFGLKEELASANSRLERLVQGARRAQVIDRLTGRTLDVETFLSLPNGDEGSLIWILDMDACSGCFDSVVAWNVVADGLTGRRKAYIVVSGSLSDAAALNLRTARRDSLIHLTQAQVRSQIGSYLPNTKLVLGADQIIELADSRYGGQFCGWNFEALVARHLDVEVSIPIRDATPRTCPDLDPSEVLGPVHTSPVRSPQTGYSQHAKPE
jgi:hypothetical protein